MGHYELLCDLYLGQTSNADLMDASERERLHVSTPLDELVPQLLASGRDVVLTGNPGDGKSHLVRHLVDHERTQGAVVELDLSAARTQDVVAAWTAAQLAGRPYLLCANEGPLTHLLAELGGHTVLGECARELREQLGRLVVARREELPPQPRAAVLIDLADRDLLDPDLVSRALVRVADEIYMPDHPLDVDLAAGQNIDLLAQHAAARQALARVIGVAGRHVTEHVTFRLLWGTISYALCRGLTVEQQEQRLRGGKTGLGTYPLDFVQHRRGQGALLRALREHADPARVPAPHLDEALWATGQPATGRWLQPCDPGEAPARTWERGSKALALDRFASLKRLVALAHEAGAELLDRLEHEALDRPSATDDESLFELLTTGIRRSYLAIAEEPAAPPWLHHGLPLWVGLSYRNVPASERPHVAASAISPDELELCRPVRAPWLGAALGPAPERAWLRHRPSGISLRVDPLMLAGLRRAATTDGPLEPPPRVQRFLARLAGWAEQQQAGGQQVFAVVERPRGELVVAAGVDRSPQGHRYVSH